MTGSWLSQLGVDDHSERTIAIWCTLFGLGGVILLFMDKWGFNHAIALWAACTLVSIAYHWVHRPVDDELLE